MKLNKSFIGINYHQAIKMKELVISQLMDLRLLKPLVDVSGIDPNDFSDDKKEEHINRLILAAGWNREEYEYREEKLKIVNDNKNHKLFYITDKVQNHSELIKFDKIKLAWFRNVKSQAGTYITSKEEFFRYTVEHGKTIYVLHMYKDPSLNHEAVAKLAESPLYKNSPLKDYMGYRFDTFIIHLDEDKYPDGYMPENLELGQKLINKQRFIQMMLFIELSEIELVMVEAGRKKMLDEKWDKKLEGRVKNESDINVILVNTAWNKVTVRTESFSVKGHLRIQPYGPGRSLFKPIWIDEFEKHGYVRHGGGDEHKYE
jgi:hypothetical protein